MKICHIAPIPHLLDLIEEDQTTHLVVADKILESEKYLSFYRQRIMRGDFVIMDSMAFERPEGTPMGTMVEAAQRLHPSEIVLPDDMEDGERTVAMARVAVGEFRFRLGTKTQFMGVPHGRTLEHYLQIALALGRIPHVTTLGIQEEVEELYGISRLEVCKRVSVATRKQLHLLGVTEDLHEWKDPEMRSLVRTCDTAKLVVYGFGGHRVLPTTKKVPKYPGRSKFGGRVGYFDHAQDTDHNEADTLPITLENIRSWNEYMNGGSASV